MFTETLTERQVLAAAPITTINNAATASINTGNGINMGVVRRARAFLHLGPGANGSLVNFSLQASATSGGSFSAITAGLTTLPALTNLNTNNALYTIEISADLMPAGRPWLQAIASETNSAGVAADLVLIGDESEYKPANSQSPALSTITPTNAVVAHV